MYEIMGLPKNADIRIGDFHLEIKNQKIIGYKYSLMYSMLSGRWDEIISEMIKQGFRYEAVIERWIWELKNDHESLAEVMGNHYGIIEGDWGVLRYSSSPEGRRMALEIIYEINRCRDWTEFARRIKPDSVFHRYAEKRIRREMDSWFKIGTVQDYLNNVYEWLKYGEFSKTEIGRHVIMCIIEVIRHCKDRQEMKQNFAFGSELHRDLQEKIKKETILCNR